MMKTLFNKRLFFNAVFRSAAAVACVVLFAFQAHAAVNDPYVVGTPTGLTFNEDSVDHVIRVRVNDPDGLNTNIVLTVTSDNTTVLPSGSMVVTQDGADYREITVNPAPHQNNTFDITIHLVDEDNDSSSEDFSVTVTEVPDTPVIHGWTSSVTMQDKDGSVKPYSGVSITDADQGNNNDENITVTLSFDETLLPGEFAESSESPITFSGKPDQVTAKLQNLIFTPFENRVAVGDFASADIEIKVKDLDNIEVIANGTIDVESMNDVPVISVTVSPSVIDDTASASPFSITILDPDVEESFTATVTISNDPTNRYGTVLPSGTITPGNMTSIEQAVAAIRYQPYANVVAGSIGLEFVFEVNDGNGGSDQETHTLTINEVSDPPTISGIYDILKRTDDSTSITPFPTALIEDPDREASEPLLVTVTVSDPALGSMQPATTNDAPPLAATSWLQSTMFVPNANSVAVGDVQVVVLTVTVVDKAGNVRTDSQTRVAITGINGAPVIENAPPVGTIRTVLPGDPRPFETMYVSDDENSDLILTIAMDDHEKGTLTSSDPGFNEIASGYYAFTNDLVAISNLLDGLQFNVNSNYSFPAGAFGDTTFTLTVEDMLENRDTAEVHIVLSENLRNFLVTSDEDTLLEGSLRYALSQASAGDYISFALMEYPALIRLEPTLGAITLNRHITFKGPGADMLRISGDNDGDGSPDMQLFRVNATVVMEGLTLESGIAQTGGAISVGVGGSLTMNYCVVKDSEATLWGGGIDVLGRITMRNCLVKNNQTSFASGLGGGGVSLYSKQPCMFINTTFSGNSQSAPTGYGGGGALFVENKDAQVFFYVDIQHCTFAENTDASVQKQASALSVITMGSNVRLLNSIFSDETGRNISLYSGTISSLGGNLSDDAATVLKSGATDETKLFIGPGDQTNVVNISLGVLSKLEGPTELYPLLAGSAAINSGQTCGVGEDQRGVHRPSTPDSGSYERESLTRVTINEVQCKDAPADFIEFYIPRDSLTVDLDGYQILVNGDLCHTFGSTSLAPGSGIVLAASVFTLTDIDVVVPNGVPLVLEEQGTITMINPAGQVVSVTTFVDKFPDLSASAYAGVSLTLSPQFSGHALLPHSHVMAPPFGGWDTGSTSQDYSPGADTAMTVFGADNATPVAIADLVELGEDMLTFIPVLANDFDADGSDDVVVTGVPVVFSNTTAMGASYWMRTNAVTGYGDGVYYDPRTSEIFNSLPNGADATDTFLYRIADVGSGPIISIVSTNSGNSVQITAEGHRLSNGAMVQIYGTVDYNGIYSISNVTADTFVVGVAFEQIESAGTWVAKELRGASSEAEVTITVIGANDYPVAGTDTFSCGEEDVLRVLADPDAGVVFDDAALYPVPVTLASGNLLNNDSDIDTDDNNSSLLVVGVLDGVTAIDSFSGTENLTPVTVHSAYHGLTTGDSIVISGYDGHPTYNGEHLVTVVDEDSFTIPVVFVDDADVKGVWGLLDDGNRLTATSALEASVKLDIRVDREETHLIYNPRVSSVLNAISLGAFRVDTFYYAVADSHNAVSIGRIDITVSGVNELPDNAPDPDSLKVLYPFITVSNTLADVLSGLTVVDAVGAASGVPGRADVRVFADGSTEAESVVITDSWFTKESDVLEINTADLLVNDSDQDTNDTLRVFAVLDSVSGVEVTLDTNTNIQYNAAGSGVMDALAQGEPLLDYFRVVITDDQGGFVTNEVVVVVMGVNDTPFTFDDNITIDEDVEIFAFDPRAVMSTNDPSGRFSYTSADPNDYDLDVNGTLPDNELWIIPTNATVSSHMAKYSLTNNLMTYYPFSSTNEPKHAVGPWGLSLDGLSATSRLDDAIAYTVTDQSLFFAENDLFRVEADGSGFVLNVLTNDRNYNIRGGDIFISAVGVPDSRGEVSITGDGTTLTYSPEINFVGDETFTYTITNIYGNLDKARVTVRVTTELFNGDLQVNDDAYSIALGEEVTLNVLANDNRLPGSGSELIITRLITNNQPHVRLVNNKIVYVQTNALITSETFSYEAAGAADGDVSFVADVSIRIINRTKKLPVQDDFFTVQYGSVEQQLDVLANDFILPVARDYTILKIDGTPNGTVTNDTVNNTLKYTAKPGFIGRDIFGYTITDNLGGTGSGTVTVYVGVPTAVNDVYTVEATAGSYTLNVMVNDMVLPGSAGSVVIDSVVGVPSNGSVTDNGSVLTFTSNGTVGTGTVEYVISDGIRTSRAAVSVNTVGDGLYATKDTFHVLVDSESITLNVLNNDRSFPYVGRQLTITGIGTGVNAPDQGGTVVIAADSKSLTYTPAPGFTGEETFSYGMTDARLTDGAKVVIKVVSPVIAVNDDRFAVFHEGNKTGEFSLPVLDNDSFLPEQGGLFEIVGVGIEGNGPDADGKVYISADGQNLIYQPDTNYVGSGSYVETFTYEASDGTDVRVEGIVMVNVYPQSEGRIPERNADVFSVQRNSVGNILPVLANDAVMPATAAEWSISDISDPAFGGVVSVVDLTILYTPPPDFVGTDTFIYSVNNGLGSTVQAQVTVKVGSLLLNPDEFAVISGSSANAIDVLLNDGILPGPEFVPVIDTTINMALIGTVSAATNMIYYTPSNIYTGEYPYVDTVIYGVIDDSGLTQTQRVSVLVVEEGSDRSSSVITFTVEGVNDLPVLHNFGVPAQTDDKHTVAPFPTSFITDVDEWGSEPLIVSITIDDPVKGSLTNLGIFTEINPGEYVVSNVTPAAVSAAVQALVYVPVENRITVGTLENTLFTVRVWDPYVSAPVVDITTVQVTPVNDPPVISGTKADQPVYENSRLHPFSAVTITEVDDLTLQPLNVEVQIDILSQGYISSLGIFADIGGGRYTVAGATAAQVTDALRAMIFEPTTNSRISETNQTETTRLTIIVDDQFADPVVDNTTSVIANDAWVRGAISEWGPDSTTGFGDAVGSTRDIVAVGSPHINDGAVSLYYRNLGGAEAWGFFGDIVPTNVTENAQFGYSVAMQDDLLIVGATDDADQGSVSIYQQNKGGPDAWGLVTTLMDPVGSANDLFGCSVAISGDTLIVGASHAFGSRAASGEVFIYRRNEGGADNWGYVDSLVPTDNVFSTRFGFDVAIHENRIIVGAPYDMTFNFRSGAAYTFARSSESAPWTPVQKIYGDTLGQNDQFGYAVDVYDDIAVAGAPMADFNESGYGTANIFQDTGAGTPWTLIKVVKRSVNYVGYRFGLSVQVDRGLIVVGAPSITYGVHGEVYVYGRDEGGDNTWGVLDIFKDVFNEGWNDFGFAISLEQQTLAVCSSSDKFIPESPGVLNVYRFKFNNGPVALSSIPDQSATVLDAFELIVDPVMLFADADFEDSLVLSAVILPDNWLSFDSVSGTFSGTPLSTGTVSVVLIATDLDGEAASNTFSVVVEMPAGGVDPYELWLALNFGAGSSPTNSLGNIWDPNADPDLDNLYNRQEYVFGSDPNVANDADHIMSLQETAPGTLELVYRRRSNDPSLTFVIEKSTDLLIWTDATALIVSESVSALTLEVEEVTVTLSLPGPKCFFKIVVYD